MSDVTVSSRDVIRAAIEEWYDPDDATPNLGDLAERIDQALFHIDEQDERVIEDWAVGEAAKREATRTALAELEGEVRSLWPAGTVATAFTYEMLCHGRPRIATLLRDASHAAPGALGGAGTARPDPGAPEP